MLKLIQHHRKKQERIILKIIAAVAYIIKLIHLIGFYKFIEASPFEITECINNSLCSCNYEEYYEIKCPADNPKTTVYGNEYSVRITCNNALVSDYLKLPKMAFGDMEDVEFNLCPLPTNGSSVLSVFNRLGIRKIQELYLGLNDSETLVKQHLSGFKELETLEINADSLEMTNNLLDDLNNLTWLQLTSKNIHLPIDIFQNLKKLEHISFRGGNLQWLEPGIFRNQQKLKTLHFTENIFQNLSKEVFQGASCMHELSLVSNTIERIQYDAFFHLTNLSEISLIGNRLNALPSKLFKFNKNLSQIIIRDNDVALKILPRRFLADLPRLRYVQFLRCGLKYVPDNLIHRSTYIEILSLAENNVKSLPRDLFINQTNIVNLDLRRNQLNELDDDLFATTTSLEVLNLSFNKIAKLPKTIFRNLRNLKELYLNNNKLIVIYPQIFMPVSNSLRYLQLKNNGLNSTNILIINYFFSENLLANIVHKITKGIDSTVIILETNSTRINEKATIVPNKLQCDCSILHFIHFLRMEKGKSDEDLEIILGGLTCLGPKELAGKQVEMVQSMDLLCLLDSTRTHINLCPELCECKVRATYKTMIINCSDASLTSVPNLPIPRSLSLDSIELYIENNNITVLPSRTNEGAYNYVTKIYANNNQIASLLPENIPENLSRLELTSNRLNRINSSVLETLFRTGTKLLLGYNPWICDCKTKDFLLYIQRHLVQIEDLKDIQCPQEHSLNELQIKDLCPGERFNISLTSIAIALLGLIIGILVAIYYKYQHEVKVWMFANSCCLRLITEEDLDKDKIYDAFISYSHKDVDFLVKEIVPYLEKSPHKYKLCLHDRDWLAGDYIQESVSVKDAGTFL